MNMNIRNNASDLVTSAITIDGTEVPGEYMVSGIETEHEINRIPTASVKIADGSPVEADFEASAQSMFAPGGEIEIKLGFHANNTSVFKGLILKQQISVARDGSSHLTLICRDAAIKTTLTRSSVQFHEATDSDVITTLLKKAGLNADVESTSLQREHQIKSHASDWDFIISRAEANGLITNVRDGKVKISKPSFKSPDVEVEYGDTLGTIELELDATHQMTGVSSNSWDPKTQSVVSGDATEPSVNDQGDLDGKKLAAVLDLPPLNLQSSAPLSVEELKTWSDAQMLKSRMSRVRGKARFTGSADIKPDQSLDLAGLGKRFNGAGYVSRVRHILSEGEWTTEVGFGLPRDWYSDLRRDASAPNAAGLRPGVSGLQIGNVLKIDEDPQGQRRIQVAMPLQADGEQGVWVRMASLYATKEAGIAFMPEIGDEVVLGFLDGDPDAGVVLGALQSGERPAPEVPDAPNTIKSIVTNAKLKIAFDDVKKSLTLETPGGHSIVMDDEETKVTVTDSSGNTIEMSDAGMTLKSPKDFSIEASGSVSIKGTSGVTINSPGDVALKGANLTAEGDVGGTFKGGATAELSAGGQTTVKGGMVMIN